MRNVHGRTHAYSCVSNVPPHATNYRADKHTHPAAAHTRQHSRAQAAPQWRTANRAAAQRSTYSHTHGQYTRQSRPAETIARHCYRGREYACARSAPLTGCPAREARLSQRLLLGEARALGSDRRERTEWPAKKTRKAGAWQSGISKKFWRPEGAHRAWRFAPTPSRFPAG